MDSKKTLLAALKAVGRSFAADELAYLSLTSKAEHAVRDRLAFELHQRRQRTGGLIAREWSRRYDLAVLRNPRSPECILEIKSFFASDLKRAENFAVVKAALQKDRSKLDAATKTYPDAAALQLLLLARTHCRPPKELDGVIKYGNLLREFHVASEADLHALANSLLKKPQDGSWTAGTAFGVEVTVHYWLF